MTSSPPSNDGSSTSSSQPSRTPGGRRGRRGGGRDEPDQLAVAVALGAPGLAGAGHDAEAAAEGRELVEERLAGLERRERRRVGGAVADLDARVAPWCRAAARSPAGGRGGSRW